MILPAGLITTLVVTSSTLAGSAAPSTSPGPVAALRAPAPAVPFVATLRLESGLFSAESGWLGLAAQGGFTFGNASMGLLARAAWSPRSRAAGGRSESFIRDAFGLDLMLYADSALPIGAELSLVFYLAAGVSVTHALDGVGSYPARQQRRTYLLPKLEFGGALSAPLTRHHAFEIGASISNAPDLDTVAETAWGGFDVAFRVFLGVRFGGAATSEGPG